MIDEANLQLLQRWGKQDSSLEKAVKAYPEMQRGAVYWYRFREPVVIKGEVYKRRPVVIMARSPYEILANNLHMPVIPLSTSEQHEQDERGVAIHFRNGERAAVVCQATTINWHRLENFEEVLSPRDMRVICDAFALHLKPIEGHSSRYLRPGHIFKIAWHDEDHPRAVMIGSAGHIGDSTCPVITLPFDSISDAYGGSPTIKVRPIARQRLYDGEHLGHVNPKILEQARQSVRRSFGLTV